jgi:uncharacterized protein (DUF983 family)
VNITRGQVLVRGLRNQCPNCGEPIRARAGRRFRIDEACPRCGLVFDRGDGAFLGPFVVNYSFTAFGFVVPVIILYAAGVLGPTATLLLAGGGALLLPLLLYRVSWSWWLMLYYFFLTDNLPANRGDRPEDDE